MDTFEKKPSLKEPIKKKASKKPKPGSLEALAVAVKIMKKNNLDFSYLQ